MAEQNLAQDKIDWQGQVAPVVDLPRKLQQLVQDEPKQALDIYEEHKSTLDAWVDAGVDGAEDIRHQCEAALQT